jgi:FkbM family methyltransferase
VTDAISIGKHTELRYTAHGLLCYNRLDWPISEHLIKYGECAWMEVDFLGCLVKPEWTVIEAGAHIGTHTVPLSKMVKRLFAFEPQRANYNYLCANLALNECDNVKAMRYAIGYQDGSIGVPILDPDAPNNTGGVVLGPQRDGWEQVPLKSLDSLDIPFDFLKADVEDMEIQVLRHSCCTWIT